MSDRVNPYTETTNNDTKRRKKIPLFEFESEDDDMKLVDEENGYDTTSTTVSTISGINNTIKLPSISNTTTTTTTTTTTAKKKKAKKAKKYSKVNKLSSLGKSKSKYGTDLNKIRAELHAFIADPVQCMKVIKRIQAEYTKRAQGADILYTKVKTPKGNVVYKKKAFLEGIEWAQRVPPGGGCNTGFGEVEMIVLIVGAYQMINCYAEELKCDKKLPPYSSGNVGKIAMCYIFIILALDYHKKYASEIWQRTKTAFQKKTKSLCNKKKTDLESLTVGSIFCGWGKPDNVQQTTQSCMESVANRHKAAKATSLPPTTATTSVPPCSPLPLKPRKINHSQIMYQKAYQLMSKIGQCIDNENESFSVPSIPSIPSNPSYALPPVPTIAPTPVPTTAPNPTSTPSKPTTAEPQDMEQANECLIYRFVGDIFKIEEDAESTPDMKQNAVAMIFRGYEQDEHKPHILNLVNYINSQSSLSDAAKLRIINLDLNELLNEF